MGDKGTRVKQKRIGHSAMDPALVSYLLDPKVKAAIDRDPEVRARVRKVRRLLNQQRVTREAQLLEWADKKIDNFLKWKMEGNAHQLTAGGGERISTGPAKTFDQMSSDEIASSTYGLEFCLDLKDWIEIKGWLQEFVAPRPEAALLEDLLVHCRYRHRPIGEFAVPVPFSAMRRQLRSLGPTSLNGALALLARFSWHVARAIELEILRKDPGGGK